jgi:hypothetical protein
MGDMIDAKIEALLKVTKYAKVDTTLQGVAGDTKTVPSWNYIGDAEDIAEGAEVELEGAQKFESIIGDGTVHGTVSALTLIADPVSTGFAVDGTYDIAHATCICLENLSAWDRKSYITVLSATDFSGKDNLNSVKFVGEVDDALASRLRLCVRNGELVVRKAAGAVVIMR